MSAYGWDYLKHVKRHRSVGLPRTSVGAPAVSLGTLLEDLDRANARWSTVEADMRGRFDAEVQPWISTISLGFDIAARVDFSNPHAFLESLASIASLAGPIGAAAGALLRAVDWLQDFLNRAAPAFAIQLQDYHYAYLDQWIAENVLSRRGATAKQSIGKMYGDGWVPIYALSSGAFCENSGGYMGTWGPEVAKPNFQTNLHLFSLIAGPRSAPIIPACADVSDASMGVWADSREGRASVEAGRRLGEILSIGGFSTAGIQEGEGVVHQSQGICFVNNLRLDIDPGMRDYNVWVNAIVVNVTKLPSALLFPIADYVSFRAKAEEEGTWNVTTERRMTKAAFGDEDQAFKEWNLLRYIHRAMRDRNIIPIAGVKEAARRSSSPSVRTETSPMVATRDGSSSSAGTVAVVGGVSLAAVILWLALS